MNRAEIQPHVAGLLSVVAALPCFSEFQDSEWAAQVWLSANRATIAAYVLAGVSVFPPCSPQAIAVAWVQRMLAGKLLTNTPKHLGCLARAIGYESGMPPPEGAYVPGAIVSPGAAVASAVDQVELSKPPSPIVWG